MKKRAKCDVLRAFEGIPRNIIVVREPQFIALINLWHSFLVANTLDVVGK